MSIGKSWCRFAISEFNSKELCLLSYYSSNEINEEQLYQIFSSYDEMNLPFYQVLISYEYTEALVAPVNHYAPDESRLVINTFYGNIINSSIVSETAQDGQMKTIYGVPKEINELFARKFPGATYRHNFSMAAKNGVESSGDEIILIDFRTSDFALMAKKDNKLLLAQNFSYASPADVLYYLLKVGEHLNLSQKQVKLSLSGLIEKDSVLFKEIYQYFLRVEFRLSSWQTNEYPSHFFTSLNDLALCAS